MLTNVQYLAIIAILIIVLTVIKMDEFKNSDLLGPYNKLCIFIKWQGSLQESQDTLIATEVLSFSVFCHTILFHGNGHNCSLLLGKLSTCLLSLVSLQRTGRML